MSEDVRSKALRDAIFAVDQRLGNAEPEREWDHDDHVREEARCHAIEAIRALLSSPQKD